jgi:hypothetical protein
MTTCYCSRLSSISNVLNQYRDYRSVYELVRGMLSIIIILSQERPSVSSFWRCIGGCLVLFGIIPSYAWQLTLFGFGCAVPYVSNDARLVHPVTELVVIPSFSSVVEQCHSSWKSFWTKVLKTSLSSSKLSNTVSADVLNLDDLPASDESFAYFPSRWRGYTTAIGLKGFALR